jgi:hypothetical protein
MVCTKEEAILVLEKWFDERSSLLLNLQAPPRAELVCFKGRIVKLPDEGFLFTGDSCSISIPLKGATFEYDEIHSGQPLPGRRQSGATPRLRLHLPPAPARRKNDAVPGASSVLSISESIR